LELNADDFQKLETLLHDIKGEISSFKNNDKHILRALLYQTLIFLNRKFNAVYPSSAKKTMNRHVAQFTQLVEGNFKQDRTVEYYAQKLHITSGHLNSLVKEYVGVNAKKYISNKIILEAKRLLRYTNMSIDQVAGHLRYDDTNYFVRAFKEQTGVTPLNFRKQKNP
jgi:AraC-like DNA-binding protein